MLPVRAVLVAVLVLFAGSAHADVQPGRQLFFNNGNPTTSNIVAARDEFAAVVLANPNHEEANFFLAVARIPALLDNDASYAPGPPLDNVRELLDALGVSTSGRELLEWTADFARDSSGDIVLPLDAPSGPDIQQFLRSVVMPEIDSALANLSVLSNSFATTLTPSETGLDETIEVDYGDVLAYRSLLYTAKAFLFSLSSYDIHVDPHRLIETIRNKLANFNSGLVDLYMNFLSLLPEGANTMACAKQSAIAAIEQYVAASAFIRSESDYQGDDLIYIHPEDLEQEDHFRSLLEEARTSLLSQRVGVFENKARSEIHYIDLNRLFGTGTISPVNPRHLLPYFDSEGNIPAGTFPDPTLGGILVDCTTEERLVEVSPFNLPLVFSISQRSIVMDGSESDWQTVTAMTPGYFSSNSRSWDIQYLKVAKDSSYLYWMIKFLSPTQPGTYYSFYFYRSSSQSYYNVNATIQQNGGYSVRVYPSQQSYTGGSADYRVGGYVVEGRIPLWLVDLSRTLGVGTYANQWDMGYSTYLSDASILSAMTVPVALAGADQVVYDSVTLNGRVVYPDKIITSWEWSLWHRTYSAYNHTATGQSPTLTNLAPGIYDVTLKVVDNFGKAYTDTMLLVATGKTTGLYSREEVDRAVQDERQKWDANKDGKIGLDEAIRALQVTSGMRDE